MSASRRYRIAFFAAGWLVVIVLLLRGPIGGSVRAMYLSASDSLGRWGQSLSDAEGNAAVSLRHQGRRQELKAFAPLLASIAALRNPSRMLYGAYDGKLPGSFAGVESLETRLHCRFPIISIYSAWGDRPDEGFPTRVVETIDRLGSVPMITWEPWVKDFDPQMRPNLPPLAQREYASLAGIARGDYDFYVVEWAGHAAAYGKPIFLRFAHEMNDPYRYPWGPQNGNRPDDFIAAWKHVHLIFQKKNAGNVLWVWSPHISMPWFEYYYPGDEWVDWIGTGILNYGTSAPWSRWWSFHQILEKAYPALEKLRKPLMITELGTLSAGGDPADWYSHAFYDMATKYGRIHSIIFFNQQSDVTLSTEPLNWSVLQSPRATLEVAQQIRNPKGPQAP